MEDTTAEERQLEMYLMELDELIAQEIERNTRKKKGNTDFSITPSETLASLKEERAGVWLELVTMESNSPP